MAAELFQEVSRYFSLDKIDKDNWAFKTFSKVTVGIFFASSAFSIASSYSGSAIKCQGGNEYSEAYCWLHGSHHLPANQLTLQINQGNKCFRVGAEKSSPDEPDTEYYLWVSLMLFINGALFMIPDKIWQHFEGGMLEQFGSEKNDFLDNPGKHGKVYNNLSKNLARKYFFTFITCEGLNYVIAIVNFIIIDIFLSGQFSTYGQDVLTYYLGSEESNNRNIKEIDLQSSTESVLVNPMCSVFPTVVNCKTSYFGVNGNLDEQSIICILGQNILNQKIYFVLWMWFMVLFCVSGCMIVYRCLSLCLPDFQRSIILSHLKSKNAKRLTTVNKLPLSYRDIGKWFVLVQLGRNSSPYKYRDFLEEVEERQPINNVNNV